MNKFRLKERITFLVLAFSFFLGNAWGSPVHYANTIYSYYLSSNYPNIVGPYGGYAGCLGSSWVVPMSLADVLGVDPSCGSSWVSFPQGSFIVLGPGYGTFDTIVMGKMDSPAGEWADLYVTNNFVDYIYAGKVQELYYESVIKLSDRGLFGEYKALKIVALDSGGSSPGFDLTYVGFSSGTDVSISEKNIGTVAGEPDFHDQIDALDETDSAIPQVCVGNPMNPATGNKLQIETDYVGGQSSFLKLKRFYNSQNPEATIFGAGWHSTYDRHVSWTSSTTVKAVRANGRVESFALVNGVWQTDPDVADKLERPYPGAYYLTITTSDGTKEYYNSAGKLFSISSKSGLITSLAYTGNLLSSVTGPFGHKLFFNYDDYKRVNKIVDSTGKEITYSYDQLGNLISVTYQNGGIRKYLYEDANFQNSLTGIIDENGNRFSTYAYDSSGRAISTEHFGGVEKETVSYNGVGTASVTDALGNSQDYSFISQFDLLKPASVSNQGCACGAKAYTYDANGFMASKTDFNGIVTTYTRDARGLELSRTEASGTSQARTITTTWHQSYRLPLTIIEPNRTTSFTYDDKGNALTKTITAGNLTRTWTYTYNGTGQVLTKTDPDGHTTTLTYNATGGVASVTNALGQTTNIPSYDANGRPLVIQDPNGLTTTLTYSPRGWLTSRVVGTETTTYTYDAVGQLTKATLPDGSYLSMTYDAAHRLTGISDNLGNRIAYTLDAMSNRTKEEVFDPSSHLAQTRTHVYDTLNRLAKDIGAQNQTTTYGHDNNGNLISVTDPLNHITTNSYDALNRLIKTTDPTNAVTNVVYNANDLVTRITDPRNLATAYVYNGLGDRTSTQSPDTGTTTKTYDAAGNVLTSTDARGMTTTFTYDALNRLASLTYADGKTVAYAYDQGTNGKGHLTTMTDPSGSTTWTYNIYGRLLTKQQKTGDVTLTTSYTYDSATGKLSTVTYPSGRQLSYTYDTVSKKLASIQANSTTLINGLTYRPFGPVASWTQGNGKTYARSFDQDGRLVGITIGGSSPETVTLTYDAASRITGIASNLAAPKIASTGTTNFQYAATSNRQTGSAGGMSKAYTYDAAGNITGDGSATFTYGANGRLSQVTKGGTTTYAINGLGQRVAKSGSGANGGTIYFVYDEAGHLIGEYNASGTMMQETAWLGDLPVGVRKAAGQYYINPDHLGAPLSITDVSGKVVWRWDRDPYGNGEPNNDPSGLGAFKYNLRFPGQYYDNETGLHYNNFRDYNPKTGRYVQSDPVGLSGGINTYGYARLSPLNFIDVLGLQFAPMQGPYVVTVSSTPQAWMYMGSTTASDANYTVAVNGPDLIDQLIAMHDAQNDAQHEGERRILAWQIESYENLIDDIDKESSKKTDENSCEPNKRPYIRDQYNSSMWSCNGAECKTLEKVRQLYIDKFNSLYGNKFKNEDLLSGLVGY